MHLKFYLTFILFVTVLTAHSQPVDTDLFIDSMKSGITKFFVNQNILKTSEVKGSLKSVFATEIKAETALGYSTNGIYRIGVFQSHTEQHILIKENLEFRIYDIREIEVVLKAVINFSEKNSISADLTLFYIKEIIEMFEENYKKIPNAGGKLNGVVYVK
jgi:hypothetical protein